MEATGFWTELRVADRRTLTEQATRRLFRRGETLCRQGDRSASVLMLLSGHVRIMHLTPDGREILVGVRGAGDIVGELAAIDEKPRSATVEALERLEALEVSRGRFVSLCQRESRVAWALLLVLATRFRSMDQHWLDSSGGAISRRVAAQLMQLAIQHGVWRGTDIEVVVPGTQAELATTAAISRESWARATRELRRQGVISTGRRRITIHRIAELRHQAR
ncbi:MAG TPA: Crp/Fnr family transcriptional regulator [Amycolatopsis sp.]|nr:Crp/Fnr family transcriptional regulator [Amycolatopsis sp.]